VTASAEKSNLGSVATFQFSIPDPGGGSAPGTSGSVAGTQTAAPQSPWPALALRLCLRLTIPLSRKPISFSREGTFRSLSDTLD
jgi:hypothetical protein